MQAFDLGAAGRAQAAKVISWLLALLLLAGCATQADTSTFDFAGLPRRAELVDVPFYPDDSYYCGPAALATSLSAAGFPAKPEELIDQVFLPGRQGSLQIEMISAARRQGAIATQIPGSLEAVLREIAAGHPVLVLQNLGLSWAPSWHYAVAVGYDLDSSTVLFRSGPMKLQKMSLRTFMHTWTRSDRWAIVTTHADQLPASATQAEVVRALIAFERNASPALSAQAYRTGLRRWPSNATLAMGLGNALYAGGDKAEAESVFAQAAERHQLAAAYNNWARLVLERGRVSEARSIAERGLSVAGQLRETLLETLKAANSTDLAPR